jgi:hypothetical protein
VIFCREKDKCIIKQDPDKKLAETLQEVPKDCKFSIILGYRLSKNYFVMFDNIIVLASHYDEDDARKLFDVIRYRRKSSFTYLNFLFNNIIYVGKRKMLELDLSKILIDCKANLRLEMDKVYTEYLAKYETKF